MMLRRAILADAADLLRWRNDAATRDNSRDPSIVTPEVHIVWLKTRLADPRERIFVASDQGETIGTGRLMQGPHDIELSLTVDPEHRGKGHARRLIHALVQEAMDPRTRNMPRVIAQVAVDNPHSLIAFLHEGFRPVEIVNHVNVINSREHAWREDRQWMWLRYGPA